MFRHRLWSSGGAPPPTLPIAQWRRRLLVACSSTSARQSAAAAEEAGAAVAPAALPTPTPPRRRRTTTTKSDDDTTTTNPKTTTNALAAEAAASAAAAEAAQRRHSAALERRLGRAGLGLPAATVRRVAERSAAPRGGVPADPSVVSARAVALHRLLGPALAARVLYTHPTILARDEASLARNLGAWRATLTELDERAGAARARDRRAASGGDDGDNDDGEEANSSSSSGDDDSDGTYPSSSSAAATAMMRRLTKVPALLALRPERAVPHLFETAVLLGVPPRGWDAWAAGRAPHLASLRPDTVAAKLAAAHAALNWRADPLEEEEAPGFSAKDETRRGDSDGGSGGSSSGSDGDEQGGDEAVSMDQVRAAARRDHRWLLYASGEVRRRLGFLARALEREALGLEEEEQQQQQQRQQRHRKRPASPARPLASSEARRAAAVMFLRQPSLVCKPPELLARRLRAFATLQGIDGDWADGGQEDEEAEDQGSDGAPPSRPLPRSLRALESMPSLLNLQPESLQARWRRLTSLASRRRSWRDELGRMAPSTLSGLLALSERRVEARAARLMPVLEAVEAAEAQAEEDVYGDELLLPAPAPPARRRRARKGEGGEEGEGEEAASAPPQKPKRLPALRSLAYELKCTERAFVARRNGIIV